MPTPQATLSLPLLWSRCKNRPAPMGPSLGTFRFMTSSPCAWTLG